MLARNGKLFGIFGCLVIGIIVFFSSISFSVVDQTVISGNELMDFSKGWEVSVHNQIYKDVNIPPKIDNVKLGDTLVLEKSLQNKITDKDFLFFRASHQNVRIYIQNKLVYRFGWGEKRLFGKTPACNWVLVPLSEEYIGSKVRVELTGVYDRYKAFVNPIFIGDKSAIINKIIIHRLGSIVISLILVIVGICMFGITFILKSYRITAPFQRLGILSTLIGVWGIFIMNVLQIIYPNVYALLTLEFITFNLLFPIFVWFLLSFQYFSERKGINVIFWAYIIQFVFVQLLQICGIADYMESIIITHAMTILGIGYILITSFIDIFRKKAASETKILLISVAVIMVLATIDLFRFYQISVDDEGFFTRIGAILLIAIWFVEVVKNMSKRFVTIAKTEVLEVLAYEDAMTGLKNRTAFEEWMNEFQNKADKQDSYIISFDMNNLKEINDSFGHIKGDLAIKTVANIIKGAFEPHGITYRIGGDEVCVIFPVTDAIDKNEVPNILKSIEDDVNKSGIELGMNLSVAFGYSKVKGEAKEDVFQAYKEADHRMYEQKNKIKNAYVKN